MSDRLTINVVVIVNEQVTNLPPSSKNTSNCYSIILIVANEQFRIQSTVYHCEALELGEGSHCVAKRGKIKYVLLKYCYGILIFCHSKTHQSQEYINFSFI